MSDSRQPHDADSILSRFVRENDITLEWAHVSSTFDSLSLEWIENMKGQPGGTELAAGFPLEPDLRLCLTDKHGQWLVSWPSDLAGRISIESEEHALQFVRLFSLLDTWYRFPEYGYLEIGAPCQAQTTGIGVVPESVCSELGLGKVQVRRVGREFRIMRPAVRFSSKEDVLVVILDETVSVDGRYAVRRLWHCPVKLAKLRLVIPEFM